MTWSSSWIKNEKEVLRYLKSGPWCMNVKNNPNNHWILVKMFQSVSEGFTKIAEKRYFLLPQIGNMCSAGQQQGMKTKACRLWFGRETDDYLNCWRTPKRIRNLPRISSINWQWTDLQAFSCLQPVDQGQWTEAKQLRMALEFAILHYFSVVVVCQKRKQVLARKMGADHWV